VLFLVLGTEMLAHWTSGGIVRLVQLFADKALDIVRIVGGLKLLPQQGLFG
jgi:hypothetical protein